MESAAGRARRRSDGGRKARRRVRTGAARQGGRRRAPYRATWLVRRSLQVAHLAIRKRPRGSRLRPAGWPLGARRNGRAVRGGAALDRGRRAPGGRRSDPTPY